MSGIADTTQHLESLLGFGEKRPRSSSASLQCALQAVLALHTFDPMGRVDVLHQRDLVAGCAALPGHDGAGSEEIFPYLQSVVSFRTIRGKLGQ